MLGKLTENQQLHRGFILSLQIISYDHFTDVHSTVSPLDLSYAQVCSCRKKKTENTESSGLGVFVALQQSEEFVSRYIICRLLHIISTLNKEPLMPVVSILDRLPLPTFKGAICKMFIPGLFTQLCVHLFFNNGRLH